ncbi:4'-phosphopantetheinyl transferase superfamily protein [Conexibacter sp. DBS9H8]|uniref:4'-phosphopantetheinyl transferase family protein n=1 Tax=Conexibacter sp. DBS9H8 TaxID=2937801 RepID=UPI00200FEEDC|nr:4'-phosphopantetheinyl transferase superfamily protein [Conexibacter sp. DBS9H8]
MLEVRILAAGAVRAALTSIAAGAPIVRDERGKPQIVGGPHVNLAHSGPLALIARADVPVGVDLEAPRRLRNPDGLARRICTPRELEWWADQPDRETALLALWVRKEAVAKAEGGGIATALSGLEVLSPVAVWGGRRWLLHDLTPPAPGFQAAVAWAGDPD